MKFTNEQLWIRFQRFYREFPSLGLAIDISRMNFGDDFLSFMIPKLERAFAAMEALEKGVIANPDEERMVGHYWLRNPSLAPTAEMRGAIEDTVSSISGFAQAIHEGTICGTRGAFTNLLLIGIGGSALGPQFIASALSQPGRDKMKAYFFDNTDPDGMDKVLDSIGPELGRTLCVVISKSGGTKETRNGMIEAKAAYGKQGLRFESHAVAITGVQSAMDQLAEKDGWLKRFPMWDWVGGRTSVLSAVGLLPAAAAGFDIRGLLAGAKACDEITRQPDLELNPAAQLALMWYYVGNGKGSKAMVVLPYKDRLELFSRYLQQLIMESLGKELDLDGTIVNQGLSVFGNKGSTDQHAYVQQLRDGSNNFFVTFIEVLQDRASASIAVEPRITSGDYLSGFFLGTREALYEKDRESITLTIRDLSAFTIGVLIALFERTVGFYASLINVNAYHQPGVEAGKKAAENVISLQLRILDFLADRKDYPMTLSQITSGIGAQERIESVFKICEHLASNPYHRVSKNTGINPFSATYQKSG